MPPFQVVGGTCVWLGPSALSWDESRQACQDMGADLVVIQSLQHCQDIMAFVLAETGDLQKSAGISHLKARGVARIYGRGVRL